MAEPHSNVVSLQAVRAGRRGAAWSHGGPQPKPKFDGGEPPVFSPPPPTSGLPGAYRIEPRRRLETRLQTLSGRWLSVNLTLKPIADLRSGGLIGCALHRSVREPGTTRGVGKIPLSVEDLEQLHRHTLWRGLPMLLEQDISYGVAPVSHRMLAHYGRSLREHNAWLRSRFSMRDRLVAELIDFDEGVTRDDLGEAVALLRGSRRGVFARLPPTYRSLARVPGSGLNGLTFDARGVREDSAAWRELQGVIQAARSLVGIVMVRDLAPDLTELARVAGATHAVIDVSRPVLV